MKLQPITAIISFLKAYGKSLSDIEIVLRKIFEQRLSLIDKSTLRTRIKETPKYPIAKAAAHLIKAGASVETIYETLISEGFPRSHARDMERAIKTTRGELK